MSTHDPTVLPPGLPAPSDDCATRHLPGRRVPPIPLPTSDAADLLLGDVRGDERRVVYAYPRTGRPGEAPLVEDWDLIPGARGCTPESCGFRDHHAELARAGADVVGLSTQDSAYQREVVERLRLPFPLVSDAGLRLTRAMRLPTFEVAGHVLLKRFTLVIRDGRVEHVHQANINPRSRVARRDRTTCPVAKCGQNVSNERGAPGSQTVLRPCTQVRYVPTRLGAVGRAVTAFPHPRSARRFPPPPRPV